MDHFRLRKYRGPEVWARVRQAYEAGESGPSVAQRFDVGLANIRKKCRREGWSRRDQAARADRALPQLDPASTPAGLWGGAPGPEAPVDRAAALESCLDHAAAAMARGDGPAALAALKAARAYTELTGQLRDPAAEAEATAAQWRAIEAICRTEAIDDAACALAEGMLAGTPRKTVHQTALMYHWRATHLGPEVAARDYATALAAEAAGHYWDEDGVLKPLDPRLGAPRLSEDDSW